MRRSCLAALAAVVPLVATGCSAGAAPEPAPSEVAGLRGVATFPGLSHDHVAKDVTYPQTPPVGGEHWQPETPYGYGWQRCGVYTEPVVDEFAVHSLEHGAVWLTYRPDAGAADVAALVGLRDIDRRYVLVSPVPDQPAPFMASAWGLQLSATSSSDPQLATFTRTYAAGAQGGEKGADCAQGSTLEQARAALAAARAGAPTGQP